MKSYWLRVFGAWLLLTFASRVMKDAEKLMQETSKGEHAETPTVESAE